MASSFIKNIWKSREAENFTMLGGMCLKDTIATVFMMVMMNEVEGRTKKKE